MFTTKYIPFTKIIDLISFLFDFYTGRIGNPRFLSNVLLYGLEVMNS